MAKPSYAPHSDPGVMVTSGEKGPAVTGLKPAPGGGGKASAVLARLKGAKAKAAKPKRKRKRLVGAARAGSVAASSPKRKG